MAVPTVRQVLNVSAYTGTGTTVTATTGSGTAVGDLLVAFHGVDSTASSVVLAAPTGTSGTWTARTTATKSTGSGTPHLVVWTRPVTVAGAQAVTVGVASQDASAHLTLYVLTGVDATTPVPSGGAAVADVAAGTTTKAAPAVTGVVDGLLLSGWQAGYFGGSSTPLTVPASMNTATATPTQDGVIQRTARESLTVSGSTGTRTGTAATSANLFRTASIVLAPASVTPTVSPFKRSKSFSATLASAPATVSFNFDEPAALDNTHLLMAVVTCAAGAGSDPSANSWGATALSGSGSNGIYLAAFAVRGDGVKNGIDLTLSLTQTNYTVTLLAFEGYVSTSPDGTPAASNDTGVTTATAGPSSATSGTNRIAVAAVGFNAGTGGTVGNWDAGFESLTNAGRVKVGARAVPLSGQVVQTSVTWTTARNTRDVLWVMQGTEPAAFPTVSRTGTATIVLTAASTSREVEKSAAPASVVLVASAASKVVFRKTGTGSLVLTATGTARAVLTRTGTASLVLSATAARTVVQRRTGAATVVLAGTATGTATGGVKTRTGSATLVLAGTATASTSSVATRTGSATVKVNGTATARAVLTRTGTSSLRLDGTATATTSGGTRTVTGSAVLTILGTATARTIHPRTGTATIGLNQATVVKVIVVERRTATADLTLAATADAITVERRVATATVTLRATGRYDAGRDITIVSVTPVVRHVIATDTGRKFNAVERRRLVKAQDTAREVTATEQKRSVRIEAHT